MSEEPYYVDDPFEDVDHAWRYIEDLPEEYHGLVIKAMDACRRTSHTFRKPAEKNKWKAITNKLAKGQMYEDWIKDCIIFAHSKNAPARRAVPISFAILTKYILNQAAMTDWLAKNPSIRRLSREDYELPD